MMISKRGDLRITVLFFSLAIFSSCLFEEFDDEPPACDSRILECVINGQRWEPRSNIGCGGGNAGYDTASATFSAIGTNCVDNAPLFFAVFIEAIDAREEGRIYPLNRAWCTFLDSRGLPHKYDSILSGQIFIQRLSLQQVGSYGNGIAQGTFNFVAWSEELQDSVVVTDGRFCDVWIN